MNERAVTVSIPDEREEFIAEQIAAGNYSDEKEMLLAGLAALERETKLRELRTLIAEGDADIAEGNVMSFDEPGSLTQYIIENAAALDAELAASAKSGISLRQIPDIMSDVKAKLRANGQL
jgi:putative addiction module CopG family antidote